MAERVGLDLSPVDPFSDEEARWLLACQWPDNPARFGRLRAALANVRAAAHPPRLERGDMLTDLPRIAATIAGDGPLVRVPLLGGGLPQRAGAAVADASRWPASTHSAPSTTSIARAPSRHLVCPPRRHHCTRAGPDLATALVHIGPGRARCASGRYPPPRVLDPLVASALSSPAFGRAKPVATDRWGNGHFDSIARRALRPESPPEWPREEVPTRKMIPAEALSVVAAEGKTQIEAGVDRNAEES